MIGNNFYNIGYDSNHFKQKKTGQSFEAEYQAILDRATALGYTKPTIDQQIKQNTLLKNMKNNNSFALNDLILVFANNGSKEFACINWKNPNGNLASLVNAPIFTINEGFTGRGSFSPNFFNDYILTGYTPTGSLNYKLNNASRYIYVKSLPANRVLDGIVANTANTITGLNSIFNKINQGGINLATNVDLSGVGMKSIHRDNNINITCINNGVPTTVLSSSLTLAANEQTILRSAGNYGTQQISFYTMGANLISQNNQIETDFLTYLNSL
jgi:hypothetical protein